MERICNVCGGCLISASKVRVPHYSKLSLSKSAAKSAKLCACNPGSVSVAATTSVTVSTEPHKIKILHDVVVRPGCSRTASASAEMQSSSRNPSVEAIAPAECVLQDVVVRPGCSSSAAPEVGKGQGSSILKSVLKGKKFNYVKYHVKNYGNAETSITLAGVSKKQKQSTQQLQHDLAELLKFSSQNLNENLSQQLSQPVQNLEQLREVVSEMMPRAEEINADLELQNFIQNSVGRCDSVGACTSFDEGLLNTPPQTQNNIVDGVTNATGEYPTPVVASVAPSVNLDEVLNLENFNEAAQTIPADMGAATPMSAGMDRAADGLDWADDGMNDVFGEYVLVLEQGEREQRERDGMDWADDDMDGLFGECVLVLEQREREQRERERQLRELEVTRRIRRNQLQSELRQLCQRLKAEQNTSVCLNRAICRLASSGASNDSDRLLNLQNQLIVSQKRAGELVNMIAVRKLLLRSLPPAR